MFCVEVIPEEELDTWENYIYKSPTERGITIEEKTYLSHNDRNNQRKLDGYHIYMCVCVYM